MRHKPRLLLIVPLVAVLQIAAAAGAEGRRVVNLDGTWDIAQGAMDQAPSLFTHRVRVPGLADMAVPAFSDVGKKESEKHRQAFWYRRSFKVEGPLPAVARLKIHKARYGARVFLNGKLVGEHLPCFTPAVLDVREYLKGNGQPNELVIRVGAWREAVPRSIPDGWDFEKIRYIPGIYDSVELILSGAPYVENVQTVPDIEKKVVRVVATVKNTGLAV
jgi:beta-galactosidase